MINNGNLWRHTCLALAVLTLLTSVGCCVRTRKKPSGKTEQHEVVKDHEEKVLPRPDEKTVSDDDSLVATKPAQHKKNKVTAELYRRLEDAFEMFKSDNIDGAQRELERVQLEINDDPYLEMQTWYLSAMIYHKSGKTSRRKRSMRKMLEVMEQLQKDPRFRRSFEDGMVSQEVIKMAIEKGEGRYVE